MCLPIVDNMQMISQSGELRLMALVQRWKGGGDAVLDWESGMFWKGWQVRAKLDWGSSGEIVGSGDHMQTTLH